MLGRRRRQNPTVPRPVDLDAHRKHLEAMYGEGKRKKRARAFIETMSAHTPQHPKVATSLELMHAGTRRKGAPLFEAINTDTRATRERTSNLSEWVNNLFAPAENDRKLMQVKHQVARSLHEVFSKQHRAEKRMQTVALLSSVLGAGALAAINPIFGAGAGVIALSNAVRLGMPRRIEAVMKARARYEIQKAYQETAKEHFRNFAAVSQIVWKDLLSFNEEGALAENYKPALEKLIDDMKNNGLLPQEATPEDAARVLSWAIRTHKYFFSLTEKQQREFIGKGIKAGAKRQLSKDRKQGREELIRARAVISTFESWLNNQDLNTLPEAVKIAIANYRASYSRLYKLARIAASLPEQFRNLPKAKNIFKEQLQKLNFFQRIKRAGANLAGASGLILGSAASAGFGFLATHAELSLLTAAGVAIPGVNIPILIAGLAGAAAVGIPILKVYDAHSRQEKLKPRKEKSSKEELEKRRQTFLTTAKDNPLPAIIQARRGRPQPPREPREPTPSKEKRVRRREKAKQLTLLGQAITNGKSKEIKQHAGPVIESNATVKEILSKVMRGKTSAEINQEAQQIHQEFNALMRKINDPDIQGELLGLLETTLKKKKKKREQLNAWFDSIEHLSEEDKAKLLRAYTIYRLTQEVTQKTEANENPEQRKAKELKALGQALGSKLKKNPLRDAEILYRISRVLELETNTKLATSEPDPIDEELNKIIQAQLTETATDKKLNLIQQIQKFKTSFKEQLPGLQRTKAEAIARLIAKNIQMALQTIQRASSEAVQKAGNNIAYWQQALQGRNPDSTQAPQTSQNIHARIQSLLNSQPYIRELAIAYAVYIGRRKNGVERFQEAAYRVQKSRASQRLINSGEERFKRTIAIARILNKPDDQITPLDRVRLLHHYASLLVLEQEHL